MVHVEVAIMAIKPGDCILNLSKLRTLEDGIDMFGRPAQVWVYPKYWSNFTRYCDKKVDWKNIRSGVGDLKYEVLKQELAKYGATHKYTKLGEEFVKFKRHSDLTFFILKWE